MAMNVKDFEEALDAIEAQKGISRETVITSLKEAMIKAYKRELGGEDANVEVDFDLDRGVVTMYNIKKVVEEIEDDFLEVSLEEAQRVNKDYKVGDDFKIPVSPEDIRKATAMSIKSIMRQKFSEVEKANLYEKFKDKVNTMVTGRVEVCDDRGCTVNIGGSSIYLSRKEMISNEKYNGGDPLKVFIEKVENSSKGPSVIISRASAGFLRCLMSETIPEIYNGTINIESVSREAGERSKVAVSCSDINVDPAGACIGPNGSKIQTIVSQLGNGTNKEKIDIITYSNIPGLFILEALKPAHTVGIEIYEEEKEATAIVKDDSLSLAIGRKGVNVRLAVKLTGYKIDVITETEAEEDEIEYISLETLQAQDEEIRKKIAYEKARASFEKRTGIEETLPGLSNDYVAPQLRDYGEEKNDFDEALEREVEEEDSVAITPNEEENVESTDEESLVKEQEIATSSNDETKENKTEPTEAIQKAEVKTTTTLEDLEKKLEGDSNKNNRQNNNFKRKKKVEEEQKDESKTKVDPSTYMSIYSEEELKEMENEEEENDSDDREEEEIDYDQYDEYYDQDK